MAPACDKVRSKAVKDVSSITSAHRCARIPRDFASLATQNVPTAVITVSAVIGLGHPALLPVSFCRVCL
jgi:hypothetical protein